MSTRNMKKQESGPHCKKNVQKNKNAEDRKNDVLVLPPDLLQKLGINLENIQSPQNLLLERNEGDCSLVDSSQCQEQKEVSNLQQESKYIPTEEKESSILETASLMKASVFLSPTFSSLKSNMLDTESNSEICIEQIIATPVDNIMSEEQNNADDLKSDDVKCVTIQLNNYNCGDGTESHNIKPICNNEIDNIVPVEASEKSSNQTHESATKIDTVNSTKKRNQQNMSSDIDDQFKKGKHYQNKGKKNFRKKTHKSSTSCLSKEQSIKIDESQNTSKVNDVKIKGIKLDSSLNVKMGFKKPKPKCGGNINDQGNQKKQTIDKSSFIVPLALDYINDIQNNPNNTMICEYNDLCSKDELYNAQQTWYKHRNLDNSQIAKDLETNSSICSLKLQQSLINIYKTPSESEILIGNAEETDYSLNQIHYTEHVNQINKNINCTQSKGNSKLCIQGVEKPGGDRESIHVHESVKTYSRRKIPKLFNTESNNIVQFSEYNKDNDIDYKITENNTYTDDSYNFCMCDDFGSFISYEVNNNSYEHIHFWKREGTPCSIENLLNIYKDTNFEDEYRNEGNEWSLSEVENMENENQLEISDDSVLSICWKNGENIRKQSKDEHVTANQHKITQNQNAEECFVATNDHIETGTNKKRKHADKTLESDSDSEKPSAKIAAITLECGVCDMKVSSREWGHHISKEHCYIAWRKGQQIDLNNKDLLIKLRKRLNDNDMLICTFCKSELYDVEKFINHIIKCKCLTKSTVETELSDIGKVAVVHATQLEFEQKQEITIIEQEIIKDSIINVKIDEKQVMENSVGTPKKIPDVPLSLVETEVKKNAEANKVSTQKQIAEVKILAVETEEKQVPEIVLLDEAEELKTFEVPLSKEKSGKNQTPKSLEVQEETGEIKTIEVPQATPGDKSVTCGVCKNVVHDDLWMEHIYQEHNYIAWKDCESPLNYDDEDAIRDYLNHIIKEIGELVCKMCGLKRKFAKSYLRHIKNCGDADQSNDTIVDQTLTADAIKTETEQTKNIKKIKTEKSKKEGTENTKRLNQKNIGVKCGVCKLELKKAQWIEHIFKDHNYLAWQEGQPEIDVNDSQQVYDHLYNIAKRSDGLTCKKCGLQRRYVKSYLNHVKSCESDTSMDKSVDDSIISATSVDELILELSKDEDAKCGVCKRDVPGKQWFNHVHLDHAYLAWKEGKTALNLENEEEVQSYLYFVSKKYNGLVCHKCGLNRKYVKTYLNHIQSCDSELVLRSIIDDGISNKETYECAVCAAVVKSKDWTDHAMNMHYNIAWAVGDFPIDVKNASVVERQLKEYRKRFDKLVCNTCRATRVSLMGFYAHIIQCGKTEEEMDQYKVFCEQCNSKYLGIYKSQHAIMHREKELTQQRRLMKDEVIKRESLEPSPSEPLFERRRAAEKAREFIEKSQMLSYNCSKCGYGASNQEEYDQHPCDKLNYKGYVDSEDSAELESSGDETAESAVDSNLSDEENVWMDRRRKKNDSSSAARKVPRIPFDIKCAKSFVRQSGEEYCKLFLSNGTLHPQWRSCSIEVVSDDQLDKYLPPLKESCKVIIGRSDPVTYQRFEAKKQNGYSVFVGGCIQCISWAPPHVDDERDEFGHFLAVACHNDVDLPRLDYTKTYQYPGMLQIWDFGDLSSTNPEFSFGIAHDYGTIWAIDWCPSGTRDIPLDSDFKSESTDTILRLGLLAVACSNGFAYIYCVPYPSSVKSSDKNVFKLTPVAELRLSGGQRAISQATSINWSTQNGHANVVVGYSNGTVASYNLECDSPLLMEAEDGVNIFYPFQDERPHSSCITDVKTFPSNIGVGLVSSMSPTGCETVLYRGLSRVHKHLPSASGAFAPHWPSLMLAGNDIIVNSSVNELDLWGVGRRTGAVQKCCGCVHCGHMAMFVPPVVKLLTTHPAYPDFHKQPIAVFQMRSLSQKRTKYKNDELQVKLEPLDYHEAVKTYALDFKLMKDLDKEQYKQVNRPREQYPERFPLSDVPSMAFYPSRNHHKKLAAATHAGLIFILNDDTKL